MEELKAISRSRIRNTPRDFVRNAMQDIHWENRLTCIRGARGTGKTTLLLQRLAQLEVPMEEKLYASLDNVFFTENDLYHLARDFASRGGRYLFLDEVHKYPRWSQEIKNIYDDLPELHVAFTGSSLLSLRTGSADLSRRAVIYDLPGLSLREFAAISQGIHLSKYALEDILAHGDDIADEVLNQTKPLQLFGHYLRMGYYPFSQEGEEVYFQRLEEVAGYVIDVEIPLLKKIDPAMSRKVKQLLYIISQSAPFIPNVTKLSERIGISRITLLGYLEALQESRLTMNLSKPNKGISLLQKPDKLYLENTNLMYAFSGSQTDIGSVRETFFANQLLAAGHKVCISPVSDFLIDGEFTFEIGGQGKGKRQIQNVPQSYIAADDIEYGNGQRIPLWQFGLLY